LSTHTHCTFQVISTFYSFAAHFSMAVPSSGKYANFTNCTTCFLLYSMAQSMFCHAGN